MEARIHDEMVCGSLVLPGLLTRVAVIPLLIIMTVALLSTKLPIFLKAGFWQMAHDSRTDLSMTLGALFLLIVGAGEWSLDAWLHRRIEKTASRAEGRLDGSDPPGL